MPDPIQHIIVLMLENNSFDRMLGAMKEVFSKLEGPNKDRPYTNPDYPDATHEFAQLPGAARSVPVDPAHDLDDVLRQINNGDCKGFVADFAQHRPQAPQSERYQIMSYFTRGDLPVLHTLAENFAICDHWFSSMPGPTWPNRFFVHSGTSLGHVDMPSGFFNSRIHVYNQPTVYQRLTERNISWCIYYGDIAQSLVMTKQLDYLTHYRKMEHFAADARGPASQFPQYIFIEPTYFGTGQNDEHPPTDVMRGEALVSQIYNTIRANEELWASTLLVLLYDEHGGFFDHVAPPKTIAPDDHTEDFAFNILGVRVPALLISPWVDAGVCDVVLDHTSLLRYATHKWDLGPLGNRVAQANSFASAISRTSQRTDCPLTIASPVAQPDPTDLELNAHQVALAGFSHHLEVNHTKPSEQTIAAHSRAMDSDFQAQSQAVAERVDQFFAAAGARPAAARPQ